MGRRRNPLVEIISRQIQHCRILNPTDGDLVQFLVSNYHSYRRAKRRQLESMVREARDRNNEAELPACATPSPGRRRSYNFSGADSSEVSTTEDAMYGEKLEVNTDVMKDALREKYAKQARVEEAIKAEKQMKMEIDEKRGDKAADGGKKGLQMRKLDFDLEPKKMEGPRFDDMGGMDKVLEGIIKEVLGPICYPKIPNYLGVTPPVSGILLHGPPGCGKTMLANAIANESGLPFYKISASEIVSGVSGASEENIRELFSKAVRTAPSIVFIDEIDVFASKREHAQRNMGQRIVTQLITCMGESQQACLAASSDLAPEASDQPSRQVLVIGATSHPDAIDSALRRPGRFDREIYLGVPDEKARVQILSVLTRGLRLEGSLDILKIARMTPGYVGGDLAYLKLMAGNRAMWRVIDPSPSNAIQWWKQPWQPDELDNVSITMDDFKEAVKLVQPSSKREGFSTIPDVTWDDVGGLDDLKKVFDLHIVKRIKFPENFENSGMDSDTGFLLYGPPGCGKTLVAKAVANDAGANFIHIKGPEILNKYVGESEMAVRTIFNRARTCAPCVIFFDEVDALTTKRGKDGGRVVESVGMQLMIELDGGDKRTNVFVIGATNRRKAMDPAFLRSGRFGEHLYVGYPSPDQRAQILKAVSRKKPIDSDVNLDALARSAACENFSGADLSALVTKATAMAFVESGIPEQSGNAGSISMIRMKHFEEALGSIRSRKSAKQTTNDLKVKKTRLLGMKRESRMKSRDRKRRSRDRASEQKIETRVLRKKRVDD